MEKLLVMVLFCLVANSFAFRLFRSEDEEERPVSNDFLRDMLEDDDEPEAIDNTYKLLDTVMLDEASIMGGKVEWFYGKGEKLVCVNSQKELEPKCRWRGLVVEAKDKDPQKIKMQVIKKYCKRAGLRWPGVVKVSC